MFGTRFTILLIQINILSAKKTITNSSYLQIELSKAQTQLPNQTNNYKNDQEKLAGVT